MVFLYYPYFKKEVKSKQPVMILEVFLIFYNPINSEIGLLYQIILHTLRRYYQLTYYHAKCRKANRVLLEMESEEILWSSKVILKFWVPTLIR